MSQAVNVLAFDLGASSGRAIVGTWQDGRLTATEIHRFPNDPVQVGDRLYWDILRLYHEIKQGILKARHLGYELSSIGIDSWAVDFGLIGKSGELLANPFHYRDHHTDGKMEEVIAQYGQDAIFKASGIQFLTFNTLYQLYAMKQAGSLALEHAESLLMIPDLLRYFLTGERYGEWTNASTTQMLNPTTGDWDEGLLKFLGIDKSLFPPVVQPGTRVGTLSPAVCEELRVPPIPVIAVAEHDTGAAVAAVPASGPDFAYISCGTWSLLGTELPHPVLSEQALAWNFTNEAGVNRTYRLLKNIMGLWLVQESKRAWEKDGHSYSHPELIQLAEQAEPFAFVIDPDDDAFLHPANMPEAIREYCLSTGQQAPETPGQIIRCILESLAFKYRLILERTEALAGKTFDGLHMVGGGIQNQMLCRMTASAIGRPVWAGPAEGSALGNLTVQLTSLGAIADLQAARTAIAASFPLATYEPEDRDVWERAYAEFRRITGC